MHNAFFRFIILFDTLSAGSELVRGRFTFVVAYVCLAAALFWLYQGPEKRWARRTWRRLGFYYSFYRGKGSNPFSAANEAVRVVFS